MGGGATGCRSDVKRFLFVCVCEGSSSSGAIEGYFQACGSLGCRSGDCLQTNAIKVGSIVPGHGKRRENDGEQHGQGREKEEHRNCQVWGRFEGRSEGSKPCHKKRGKIRTMLQVCKSKGSRDCGAGALRHEVGNEEGNDTNKPWRITP